ncbi:hypothetical protein M9H77_03192 [Catharanthus roseus]|uniref:Uncharacterized protein n=1 Tax=Catharanthus roseus TaxID=4058 RepID=A0ACC0CAH4_CATRO|nr:hypothetical protein M9H77_03192 [Catharanthus roseus]
MRYPSHRRIKEEKLELSDKAQWLCIILINNAQAVEAGHYALSASTALTQSPHFLSFSSVAAASSLSFFFFPLPCCSDFAIVPAVLYTVAAAAAYFTLPFLPLPPPLFPDGRSASACASGPIVTNVLSRQHEHRSGLIWSRDRETYYIDFQCRHFGRNLFQCYSAAPRRFVEIIDRTGLGGVFRCG